MEETDFGGGVKVVAELNSKVGKTPAFRKLEGDPTPAHEPSAEQKALIESPEVAKARVDKVNALDVPDSMKTAMIVRRASDEKIDQMASDWKSLKVVELDGTTWGEAK
jgi:hypothetical protein